MGGDRVWKVTPAIGVCSFFYRLINNYMLITLFGKYINTIEAIKDIIHELIVFYASLLLLLFQMHFFFSFELTFRSLHVIILWSVNNS